VGIGLDLKDSYIRQAMEREAKQIDRMIYDQLLRDAAYWMPKYILTIDKEGQTTLNYSNPTPVRSLVPANNLTVRVTQPKSSTLTVESIKPGHVFSTVNGNVYLRLCDSYTQISGGVSAGFSVSNRDSLGKLYPLNVVADHGPLSVVVD
jgi:hypothetical protein